MPDITKATITLLFADIEGSTRLLDEIGDEYASVLESYRELLEQAIALGEGRTVNTEGDGHFAAFPTPSGGVIAATTAQRLLSQHEWPRGKDVRTRMGVHVGEVWQTLNDFAGPEVHRAARIASAAHGGQTLVSQAVLAGLEAGLPDGVEAIDLGSHMLKDLAQPERLYNLAVEGLRTEFPPIRTLETGAHNLQMQLTSFVARQEEMAAIRSMLKQNRLVGITGPGGVGKTRLATQVAAADLRRHPDGVWLVELAAIGEPEMLEAEVARSLRVQQEATAPVRDTVLRYLADKQLLLVLDNCEHVVEAAADFAEHALRNCPKLQILATSQEALRIPGEAVFPLPPLAAPTGVTPEQLAESGAVQLFVERAEQVEPDFEIDADNADAIAEICTRLEGIPLALELAAARVRALSVQQIAERLDDRLRLLAGRERGRPQRHRTLRAAMEWSHDLLPEEERTLLRRLSVFRDGFTLRAVEAVCADDNCPQEWMIDLLTRLIDTSLVVPGTGDQPRHRLLETVRHYAHERLVEAGEVEAVRRRHAEHFRDLVRGGGAGLGPIELADWLESLDPDLENFTMAVQWSEDNGERDISLGLAGGLARLLYQHGYLARMRRWFGAVLEHEGHPPNHDLARVLRFSTGLAMDAGDLETAERLGSREVEVSRALGAPDVLARSLNLKAGIAWRASRFDDAAAAYEEALEIARKEDDPVVPRLLVNYAELSSEIGALDRAGALIEELERWMAASGANLFDANRVRGLYAFAIGDLDTSEAEYRIAADGYRSLGLRPALAKALQGLGLACAYSGRLAEAQEAIDESVQIYREMGDFANEAESLCALAAAHSFEGAAAAEALGTALTRYETARRADGIVDVASHAIPVAVAAGRTEDAVTLAGAAKAGYHRLGISRPKPPRTAAEQAADRAAASLNPARQSATTEQGSRLDQASLIALIRTVLSRPA